MTARMRIILSHRIDNPNLSHPTSGYFQYPVKDTLKEFILGRCGVKEKWPKSGDHHPPKKKFRFLTKYTSFPLYKTATHKIFCSGESTERLFRWFYKIKEGVKKI